MNHEYTPKELMDLVLGRGLIIKQKPGSADLSVTLANEIMDDIKREMLRLLTLGKELEAARTLDGDSAPYAPGNAASFKAADRIKYKLNGIRADVLDWIRKAGPKGATGSEISAGLNIFLYTAKPRCTELRDAGYIRDSGLTRCNPFGSQETIWISVDIAEASSHNNAT